MDMMDDRMRGAADDRTKGAADRGMKGAADGMTQEIHSRWRQWNNVCLEDPDLTRELGDIRNDKERGAERLRECFYKDLDFGTGGLRGIMGVGTNRMNVYTVARASQGYADYLKGSSREDVESFGHGERDLSLAVAYDSRLKSEEFARAAAEVFAAAGIRVYLFTELTPTPVLSYAVRYLGCCGGVVITASHNPSQYNGYKVYGADGGQITGAVAKGIYEKISGIDLFSGVERLEIDRALKDGKVVRIGQELMEAYYKAVSREAFGGEIDRSLGIVYTPLNGTGLKPVCEILRRNGFENVHVVEEQREPDGNFPTCPYPNPEKEEAMSLAIRDAELKGSDIVLATDPDCDRVGIAVRTVNGNSGDGNSGDGNPGDGNSGDRSRRQGCYRLLSGNETGVLLLDYVASRRREMGRMPERPVAFKTIVTTDLACKVAGAYGVEMRDVLTGFKYIGEQIGLLEGEGEEERFILGMEESYGYLAGTSVRDKDGVISSLLICEMAAYYKQKGMTLEQVLEQIYQKYGYYLNTQHTFMFPGESGSRKMERIMSKMRQAAVSFPAFGEDRMIKADDYLTSLSYTPGAEATSLKLPKSNALKMIWEDGTSLTVRPSGTEPKLKIYISVMGANMDDARVKERKLVHLITDAEMKF